MTEGNRMPPSGSQNPQPVPPAGSVKADTLQDTYDAMYHLPSVERRMCAHMTMTGVDTRARIDQESARNREFLEAHCDRIRRTVHDASNALAGTIEAYRHPTGTVVAAFGLGLILGLCIVGIGVC